MNLSTTEIPSKTISLKGGTSSRGMQRFVKRQVEKWIARDQSLLFLPRDRQGPFYACEVQIKIGSREWESHEYGRSLQDALTQSLAHMRYVHAVA